ncbi:MAG TPA: hypothetical protein VH479_12385 [Acidimicrobiales bacterium]
MFAYLDPGSGSLIASALVGGVAAVGVAARQARSKVTGAFGRKRRPELEPEAPAATDAGPAADGAAEPPADPA